MSWVIAGKEAGALPEIGKVYEVRHSRKGTFTGKVLNVAGEWADIERIEGKIKWLSMENKIVRGDSPEVVTIRDSLSYLIEIEA